jgi:hypothetical protein
MLPLAAVPCPIKLTDSPQLRLLGDIRSIKAAGFWALGVVPPGAVAPGWTTVIHAVLKMMASASVT